MQWTVCPQPQVLIKSSFAHHYLLCIYEGTSKTWWKIELKAKFGAFGFSMVVKPIPHTGVPGCDSWLWLTAAASQQCRCWTVAVAVISQVTRFLPFVGFWDWVSSSQLNPLGQPKPSWTFGDWTTNFIRQNVSVSQTDKRQWVGSVAKKKKLNPPIALACMFFSWNVWTSLFSSQWFSGKGG